MALLIHMGLREIEGKLVVQSFLDHMAHPIHTDLRETLFSVKRSLTRYCRPWHNISAELSKINVSVAALQNTSNFAKCGIFSSNWRHVALIDMTDPAGKCPSALHEVSNSTIKQRACGRSVSRGCSLLSWRELHPCVCGCVRGYQFYGMEAFNGGSLDPHYAEGVLITSRRPRRHLWTYARQN